MFRRPKYGRRSWTKRAQQQRTPSAKKRSQPAVAYDSDRVANNHTIGIDRNRMPRGLARWSILMAESPQRQKELFLQALDLAPDKRAAFLAQACGGDAALRGEIDAMLQAHGTPDSFLDKPAAALGATVDACCGPEPVDAEGQGAQIGSYKLLQQLGEGGMGVVYMAQQQEPVRRRVALKVIKPGMDSAQVIARFSAEQQALAMMDHQNSA